MTGIFVTEQLHHYVYPSLCYVFQKLWDPQHPFDISSYCLSALFQICPSMNICSEKVINELTTERYY